MRTFGCIFSLEEIFASVLLFLRDLREALRVILERSEESRTPVHRSSEPPAFGVVDPRLRVQWFAPRKIRDSSLRSE